jgi:hypothetical protein
MKFRGSPTANTTPKIAAIVTSPTAIDLNAMFIDSPLQISNTIIILNSGLTVQAFFSILDKIFL